MGSRPLVGLSVAAVVAAFVASGLGGVACWQWGIANRNEAAAKTNAATAKTNQEKALRNAAIAKTNEEKALRNLSASLAAQSAVVRDELPQRSVLLASESVKICKSRDLQPAVSSELSLRDS